MIKKSKLSMMAGGLALMLAMFIGCGEKSGQKEYEKALSAWADGDLVRARTLLEKSIRKTAGNEFKSLSWNKLGLVLWQLNEIDAAAEAFNESCILAERTTGANLNLGVALFQAGRLREAEIAINNVLGDEPGNSTALAVMGMIEMRKRNWDAASGHLAKTIQADPKSASGQSALALAELHRNGNSETAVNRLKRLLTTHPNYAPAAYNIAIIYDEWMDRKNDAVSWYRQYLTLAGNQGARANEARQAIARLGGTPPPTSKPTPKPVGKTAADYMEEGTRLHSEKKYDAAIESYRMALQLSPRLKNAYYNLGLAYYAQGKYTEAVQACRRAVGIDPNYANARYMLSLAHVKRGAWNDAEREAEALEEIDPKRGSEMLRYIESSR